MGSGLENLLLGKLNIQDLTPRVAWTNRNHNIAERAVLKCKKVT
jgi:hypothetical protein